MESPPFQSPPHKAKRHYKTPKKEDIPTPLPRVSLSASRILSPPTTPLRTPRRPSPSLSHYAQLVSFLPDAPPVTLSQLNIVRTLGSGAFSEVLATHNSAIQRLKRPLQSVKERQAHVERLLFLKEHLPSHETCPYILQHWQAWQQDGHLCLQTELCASVTLRDVLPCHSLLSLVWHDLSHALAACHAHGLVHMDVKPSNVLFRKDVCVLGDFGLAGPVGSAAVEEGDNWYMAPELLWHKAVQTPAADVFSLGLILYEMATERVLPSDGPEWQWLRSGEVVVQGHPQIQQMLQPDPTRRPSAKEIVPREAPDRSLLRDMLERVEEEQRQLLLLQQTSSDEFTPKVAIRPRVSTHGDLPDLPNLPP